MSGQTQADKNQNAPPKPEHQGEDRPSPVTGRRSSFNTFWLLWIAIGVALAALLVSRNWQAGHEVDSWKQFQAILRDGGAQPGSVVLKNDRIEASLKADYKTDAIEKPEGESVRAFVSIDSENRDFYLQQLDKLDVKWQDATGSQWWTLLAAWAPLLLLLGVVLFVLIGARQAAQQGPAGIMGQFGQSQHRAVTREDIDVTLDDVAGVQEAKAEVEEIIHFLKDPEKFRNVGARVPHGVLMEGPPGCGKTLLARAIAGEADVPFFSISGSDFMEMFVGVGARRVRDLFQRAKENAPCMIFLDEIDAVGRKRGRQALPGGGTGEQEQTLNAILSEMDGFQPHHKVIVIAATNRPDVLDPALTRRGRFDRKVEIPLPDFVGRQEILKIHTRKVKLAEDVDLEQLARATPMFSGADLAAIVNEAAIVAAMEDRDRVQMGDLRSARDKLRFGRAKKSRQRDEHQRLVSAYHEAGHALLQVTLDDADPIEKVTIIPRGKAQGGTFAMPERERYGYGRRYLLATMRVMCGGRIAEQKKTDDVTTGAEDDIKKVTEVADKMAREWGMSEALGFVRLSRDAEQQQWLLPERNYSDETAAKIDQEVRRLVDEAYADAEEIIEQHWQQVEAIAQALLEYETLTADDVETLMRGDRMKKSPDDKQQAEREDAVAT